MTEKTNPVYRLLVMPLTAFPVSVPALQWEGCINNTYVWYFAEITLGVTAWNARTRNECMIPGERRSLPQAAAASGGVSQ